MNIKRGFVSSIHTFIACLQASTNAMNGSDFKSGFKRFLNLDSSATSNKIERNSPCSSEDGDGDLNASAFSADDECKPSPVSNFWSQQMQLILKSSPGLISQAKAPFKLRQSAACLKDQSIFETIDAFIEASLQRTLSKDSVKSSEYRRLGNEACDEKQFNDAAYLYTLAILYAPDPQEGAIPKEPEVSALALAHEKRSALFFKLGKWSSCLVDIDEALNAGYLGHPSVRSLMIRKVECLIALGLFTEARRMWAEEPVLATPNPDGFEEDRAQKRRLKYIDLYDVQPALVSSKNEANPLIETVISLANAEHYEPSADVASLSAKIQVNNAGVQASESRPFLTINSQVQAGEVLAVELPYLAALYKTYELLFCHFCFRPLETTSPTGDSPAISEPLVPCTKCTQVLYCSPKCRSISWASFHKYECAILPALHQTGVGHLAVRILLSTGLDTIRQVVQNHSSGVGCHLKDATDVVSLYAQLYHVPPLQEATTAAESLQHAITASLLVQLAKRCQFFKGSSQLEEDMELAEDIILRHMLQLVASGCPVSQLIAVPNSECPREIQIGDALFPITSLMKRSDNPNVVPTFIQGWRMIVRASRKIAPEEEVFMPCAPKRVYQPNQ